MILGQIKALENLIGGFKKKAENEETDNTFTGKAFIVFNKQSQAEEIVWIFHRTWIRRVFNFFVYKVF